MTQILYNKAFGEQKPRTPDEYINTAIYDDKLNGLILVLPTGKLVKRYNISIIRQYFEVNKKPLEKLRIFTLQEFIEYCYDKIIPERKRYQVSEPYRLTIFEEALEKADLKFYRRNDRKMSSVLLERLANIIFGLKDDGITIAKLEEDLNKGADEQTTFFDSNRLSDILELYRNYEMCLGEKFLDFPKILTKVISAINNMPDTDLFNQAILPDTDNIVFFGFSEFRQPETEFIGKFSTTAIKTSIYIDYNVDNGPIFGNLQDSITGLFDLGFKVINHDAEWEQRDEEYFGNNEFDSTDSSFTRELFIRCRLFNTTSDIKSKGFSEMIKILACQNKYYEAQNITKLVKYLILQENYKPTEICICMRQPQMYSALFRELFSSYKIPVNISDRFELSSSPLVITVFSILNVLNLGYKMEDLHKMLGSRYIKLSEEIDTANIIAQAKKYRILGGNFRGGSSYWKKTFANRLVSIQKRIASLNNQISADKQELFRATRDENELQKAVADFDYISSMFTINTYKVKPIEFSELINKQIIEQLKLKDNIIKEYKEYYKKRDALDEIEKNTFDEAIEKDAKALKAFSELVNEFCYILEDRFPKSEHSLDELISKLKTAVTTAKYQIAEKEEYGVNITSIEQTRGIPYKVMILCGAIDGIYPMQYRTDTFLGKELKNSMIKHLNSERLQFYQFLTNDKENFNKQNKKLFFTYPTHQDDEELVRSSFIDSLLKITDIAESGNIYHINAILNSKDNIEDKLKDIPWLKTIANNRELYEHLGNSILSNKSNELIPSNSATVKYINFIFQNSYDKDKIEVDKLPQAIQEKISGYKNTPISITDLERYAGCPYKFFVVNILGLDTEQELDLSMSPMVKGSILHSILYNFYTQLKNEQLDAGNYDFIFHSSNPDISPIIPVKLDSAEKNNYLTKLLSLAHYELDYIKFEHPFYKLDENRILGSSDRISILENWLNIELSRLKGGWGFLPVLFEFGFGVGKYSKVEFVDIDSLKIKGKIDRIEMFKNEDNFKFLIADYKNRTNAKHSNSQIIDGKAFQMPLYILSAKEFLKKEYNIEPECEGGVYYSFEAEGKDKKYKYHKFNLLEQNSYFMKLYGIPTTSKSQILEKEVKLNDVLNTSLETAKSIVEKISNGIFPVEPATNECKYCNFLSICRNNKRNILEYDEEED